MGKLNDKDISWKEQIHEEATLRKSISSYHTSRDKAQKELDLKVERFRKARKDRLHRMPIDTLMDLQGKEIL